jgi:disulfide bond formation protein DsbB
MQFMTNTNNGQLSAVFIALASGGALAFALISQHVFGLLPCELCYMQRTPYALTLVFGTLCAMSAVPLREKRIVIAHCAALFVLSIGFAGYHVGVEELWWAGPTSCSGGGGALSLDGLATALTQSARPSCEEAAFRFLGISMAGYNFAASVFLAGFSFWAVTRRSWWREQ